MRRGCEEAAKKKRMVDEENARLRAKVEELEYKLRCTKQISDAMTERRWPWNEAN